ncbi:DUF5666 domain-containing protein [Cyanobium gracile]|uniref:DUF5666 domain-containing protein n=1 Tax=Cyanobium gracile (strain ATCC 27147 / PCC 6307) TaxID=292564 RepID=K9P7U0_CYAGP|nr:DUF5666 domain-containing protein [Cyanobium gracile]AFY28634.1 hypothetical protein Cyagr_1468 [Cyanobium gracile PCC 6307]
MTPSRHAPVPSLPRWPIPEVPLEGKIQSIDASRRSFVVGGQTLLTNASTHYDDGLETFADLKPGMKVKEDHSQRGDRRFAREGELDD